MRAVPPVVAHARLIASQAHVGQMDRAGEPYLTHPARVAFRVRTAGGDANAEAAAWLHDVLEDTLVTEAELRTVGVPGCVVDAVLSVSRRPGETYESLIGRAKANPIGLLVKKADVADNSDPERLSRLDPKTAARLRLKYEKAKALLDA